MDDNVTDTAAQGPASGESTEPPRREGGAPLTDFEKRLVLVLAHLLVAMAVLSMWAAADAWQRVTGLALASVLAVATALPAGVVLATLLHEWGHLAGARLAGARYGIPGKPGLFVFDFDFERNTAQQFLTMSYGGQIGGALAVLLLCFALPLDSAGRAMLVSAAAGAAVFAAAIEWPVIGRTRAGANPREELGRIDRATLYGGASKGLAATFVFWLVLA
jgi:hypothetical protein